MQHALCPFLAPHPVICGVSAIEPGTDASLPLHGRTTTSKTHGRRRLVLLDRQGAIKKTSRRGSRLRGGGGDEVSHIEVAGVAQFMLLGTDWKSKTCHEAEDDDGDDEVEKLRALLLAFHRNLHMNELP